MKIKILLLTALFTSSVGVFAQKDELKSLKKIYDKDKPSSKDFIEFTAMLAKTEPLMVSATELEKVYFNFYKVNAPFMDMMVTMDKPENANNTSLLFKYLNSENIVQFTNGSKAVVDFEKKSGKLVYTKDVEESIKVLKPILISYAVSLAGESKLKEAASVLFSIYEMDKNDVEKLYFAANYAVNAKEYEKALQYYQKLKSLNYSGESTAYYAKSVITEKEDYFGNTPDAKVDRDAKTKLKLYTNPRDEKIPSKRPEILKNIALILVELGKSEDAKIALKEARIESPEDVGLIISESDLYLKSNDMVNYKRLIYEALEKNPNNADLVFNLGVISYNNKEIVDAEKYYLRAIEIDPKYVNAYLNLAILKLDSEKILIEKMNKLGTSAPEMKKYDILKKLREEVYKGAIPYLEKVTELDSNNIEAMRTLMGVYNALEMTDKSKVLREKLKK